MFKRRRVTLGDGCTAYRRHRARARTRAGYVDIRKKCHQVSPFCIFATKTRRLDHGTQAYADSSSKSVVRTKNR
jgi:hypothetical protein